MIERESESTRERYRALFHNMVQGVFYMNSEGTITDINPAALEMIGLQREQAVGVHYSHPQFVVFSEDDRELIPAREPAIIDLMMGQPIQDKIIGVFNHKTKALVWLCCNGIPLFKNNATRPYEVFFTFEDITRLKETEAALRIEQSKLKTAMQMGGMANWEFDFKTATFFLNDLFYGLYGTSIEVEKSYCISAEKLVRRFLEPSYQCLLEAELAKLKAIFSPDYWRDLEFTVRRRDGAVRQMRSRFLLVLGEDGQPGTAVGITQDITEQKLMEDALRESEERLQLKLDSILNPGGSLEGEELRNILDIDTVQKIICDFNRLTGMTVAIGDTEGNLLVAVGFQDICQKFHRVHPGSMKNCVESDLFLARTLNKGEHAAYKCKNQMWDVVSPIYIGDKHVGNIFTGQYFYDDEEIDIDLFAEQALWYDFELDEYMKALKRVPRFSREQIDTLMEFLVRFAELISNLGFSNLRSTRAIVAQRQSDAILRETEAQYNRIADHARYMLFRMTLPEGRYDFVSGAVQDITGYSPEAFFSHPMLIRQVIHPDWLDFLEVQWQNLLGGQVPPCYEYQIIHRSGQVRWLHQDNLVVLDGQGVPVAIEGLISDITDHKEMEARSYEERAVLRALADSLPALVYYRAGDGAFLGCNQALIDFFGLPETALTGEFDHNRLPDAGFALDPIQDQAVLEGQEEIKQAEWAELPDGRRVFLETRKFPFYSDSGELLGMISISQTNL